ncbi:MAG: DUF2235 domain-containing protein [Bacteroidota bacterium]
MGKNIIICSDGTGNTTIKGRGTNVFRLYESLDLSSHLSDPTKKQQVAFYDDGVGTERLLPLKLLGGAFGYGLKRNVCQLYTELVRCYELGDHIYLFGFSRGAYTVRTLARLVLECGIINRELMNDKGEKNIVDEKQLGKKVEAAYSAFRRRNHTTLSSLMARLFNRASRKAEAGAFRKKESIKDVEHAPQGHASIKFVGVWDTVAAVGFPVHEVARFWDKYIWAFRFEDDRSVPRNIQNAYQALALDEERRSFRPMVWDETTGKRHEGFTCQQVWFPGVHTNIGGGYKQPGISLVTLDWMMSKAEEAASKKEDRLRFITAKRDAYRQQQHLGDRLYDSRAGIASLYRYQPRDLDEHTFSRGMGLKHLIHSSVFDRIQNETAGYVPINISRDSEVVHTETQPRADLVQNREALLRRGTSDHPNRLFDVVDRDRKVRSRAHMGAFLLFLIAGLFLVAMILDWIPSKVFWAVALICLMTLSYVLWSTARAKKAIYRQASKHWMEVRRHLMERMEASSQNGAHEQQNAPRQRMR